MIRKQTIAKWQNEAGKSEKDGAEHGFGQNVRNDPYGFCIGRDDLPFRSNTPTAAGYNTQRMVK